MEYKRGETFRKIIVFDFDTKALCAQHPSHDDSRAYKDVKRFFENNGFDHVQWSGYESSFPMTEIEVGALIKKLRTELDWLIGCVNSLKVGTLIGEHDFTSSFAPSEDGKNVVPELSRKPSLTDSLCDAERRHQQKMHEHSMQGAKEQDPAKNER